MHEDGSVPIPAPDATRPEILTFALTQDAYMRSGDLAAVLTAGTVQGTKAGSDGRSLSARHGWQTGRETVEDVVALELSLIACHSGPGGRTGDVPMAGDPLAAPTAESLAASGGMSLAGEPPLRRGGSVRPIVRIRHCAGADPETLAGGSLLARCTDGGSVALGSAC